MQTNSSKMPIRMIIDIIMMVLLLCLMAYQITGEMLHEWIGIIMTILVIAHQILNRNWYKTILKGKYNAYRTISVLVNVLLILSFVLTAFAGMSMSNYAVPFLYGMAKISLVRQLHLSMSHWSFVLMGLHLGLHIPMIIDRFKLKEKTRTIIYLIGSLLAGIGLYFFLQNNLFDYMFFKAAFAFLDYQKSSLIVFLENVLMLLFWVFVASQVAILLQKRSKGNKLFVQNNENTNGFENNGISQ